MIGRSCQHVVPVGAGNEFPGLCHVIFDRFIFDSDDFVPHLKGSFPLALHRDGIGRYDDEPPFDEACVERDPIKAEQFGNSSAVLCVVVVEFRDHPSRFPQVTARRVCHTPDIFGKNIVPVLVGQVFTWKEIFDHVPETEYREQTITVVGIRQVVIGFFSVEIRIGGPLVIGFVIRLRHVTVPCGSVGRTQPDQTLRKLAAERCRIPNPSDVGVVFENRIRRQYLLVFLGRCFVPAEAVDPLGQYLVASGRSGIGDQRQQLEKFEIQVVPVVRKCRMVIFHEPPHTAQYFEVSQRSAVDLRTVETRVPRIVGVLFRPGAARWEKT